MEYRKREGVGGQPQTSHVWKDGAGTSAIALLPLHFSCPRPAISRGLQQHLKFVTDYKSISVAYGTSCGQISGFRQTFFTYKTYIY